MKFHYLKYDFLVKEESDNKIITATKELIESKNNNKVVPLLYIEKNNKKFYFGDIYLYKDVYYFLLNGAIFDKKNDFHYYKLCSFDNKSKLDFNINPVSTRKLHEIIKKDMFEVLENGFYQGNVYLHEINNVIKNIYLSFNKKYTQKSIKEIIHKYFGHLEIKKPFNDKRSLYAITNDINLFFKDDLILNLNNMNHWLDLYEKKEEDFELNITLYNGYLYSNEINLFNLMKRNKLNKYSIENKEDYNVFTNQLRTGSFLVRKYDINDFKNNLKKLFKNNLLTYSLNSVNDLSLTESDIDYLLNYFQEMYVCLDESGNIVLKSFFNNNIEERKPLLDLKQSDYYKIINNNKESENEYNKYLLKLI